VGATRSGNYEGVAVKVTAATRSLLQRRGCPDCPWFIEVQRYDAKNNPVTLYRWSEHAANPLFVRLLTFPKPEKRKYVTSQPLFLEEGTIWVEFSAGKRGQELLTYGVSE
jgi:hypothetical protein